MRFSLPDNTFKVILEVLWGLSESVQSKVFVIQVNGWIEKIREVLPVRYGRSVMLIGWLVLILDAVVK